MATVLVLMRKGAQLKMGSINLMQCQGGFGCVGNHLFLERGKMVVLSPLWQHLFISWLHKK